MENIFGEYLASEIQCMANYLEWRSKIKNVNVELLGCVTRNDYFPFKKKEYVYYYQYIYHASTETFFDIMKSLYIKVNIIYITYDFCRYMYFYNNNNIEKKVIRKWRKDLKYLAKRIKRNKLSRVN